MERGRVYHAVGSGGMEGRKGYGKGGCSRYHKGAAEGRHNRFFVFLVRGRW